MIVNDHDKKWKQLKKYLRGGGSIAVQVKGGDHDDQLIMTNIDFRNDHDDHDEKISGSPLYLLINLSLYIGSAIIGL